MKPARRYLLTSALAGLAAGALPAAAQAEPDPIFALIDAQREAEARFDDAIALEDLADDRLAELTGPFPQITIGFSVTVQDWPDEPERPADRTTSPLVIRNATDIQSAYAQREVNVFVVNGLRSTLTREVTVPEAEVRAAIDDWKARSAAAWEPSGVPAAQAAREAASDAFDHATDLLLDTRPTTAAGLYAFAALAHDRQRGGYDASMYLSALVAAVLAFHGTD